eukprot:9465239-Ditylum_brightwellii.AAC.1
MSSSQTLSGALHCSDHDDVVTPNYDRDMPYNETSENMSEFTNNPISTSKIGEYAIKVSEDTSCYGAFKDILIS